MTTPVLSVACLYAIQFVSFLEGRGISAVTLSLPLVMSGFLGGLVVGGVLFSPRFLKGRGAVVTALLLGAAGSSFWAMALTAGDLASFAACFCSGMLMPPLLTRIVGVSASPGLHLGLAFGLGDFFWLFLYVLPVPPTPETMQLILMFLQALAGATAALTLQQMRSETDPEPQHAPADPLVRESLLYLSAIALVFFALSAVVDIPFYRMHESTFHIPAQVHMYIWAVYPLVGLYVDRRGTGMPLLLICLGGCLLAPVSAASSEGTVLFWIIYLISLACRGAALMYLLLVFAKLRDRFPCPAFVMSIPYTAMFLTFLCVHAWMQNFPCTTSIILWTFFFCAAFSYISSRIQYALTLSGVATPASTLASTSMATQRYDLGHFARFSEKFGISAREQDVLRCILDGNDTAGISTVLFLSTNTVKTHVRQILRKTDTRSRIALVALFFLHAGNDAPPLVDQDGTLKPTKDTSTRVPSPTLGR